MAFHPVELCAISCHYHFPSAEVHCFVHLCKHISLRWPLVSFFAEVFVTYLKCLLWMLKAPNFPLKMLGFALGEKTACGNILLI